MKDVNATFYKLYQEAQLRLKNLPDRGGARYADLETIMQHEQHGPNANTLFDEAVLMMMVKQFAEENIRACKMSCVDNMAMNPRDFDTVTRVRFSNDHLGEADKLAKSLKTMVLLIDGGDYPNAPEEEPVRLKAVNGGLAE